MIGSRVKIHPLALLHPGHLAEETRKAIQRLIHPFSDGRDYFLNQMSQAVALIAARGLCAGLV